MQANSIETLRKTTTIETIENEKIDATFGHGITKDLSLRSASETSKENESKITPVLDEMKIDEVDIDKVRVTKNKSNMNGLYQYIPMYIYSLIYDKFRLPFHRIYYLMMSIAVTLRIL